MTSRCYFSLSTRLVNTATMMSSKLHLKTKRFSRKVVGAIVQLPNFVQLLCNPMYCSLPGSSMGLPSQEYSSGSPLPSPEDFLDPGTEPMSPTWQADLYY